MEKRTRNLTEQELGIMQVIWKLESPVTVREVYEVLRESKSLAYTTVMTMMNILESKGHLEKQRQGRAFVYAPTRPRNQVISNLVEDFVDRVFQGSARPLVQRLVEDRRLSSRDLEEITRLIEENKE